MIALSTSSTNASDLWLTSRVGGWDMPASRGQRPRIWIEPLSWAHGALGIYLGDVRRVGSASDGVEQEPG